MILLYACCIQTVIDLCRSCVLTTFDKDDDGWLRSTVGRTAVFGRRTDPVLRSACSRRVTTMWVNRPLQVSQSGQLSLYHPSEVDK